jgi:H3 lysine-79-specific histone-lysine N-methyltransferase
MSNVLMGCDFINFITFQIDEIKLIASDTFVDLGSGVGQLVVHAAGATQVGKAIGIEIASLPSKFAQTLEIEFKK